MPEYKWTLKNKKYCTGCPMHQKDMDNAGDRWLTCRAGFYRNIAAMWSYTAKVLDKTRPIACVRDLGE